MKYHKEYFYWKWLIVGVLAIMLAPFTGVTIYSKDIGHSAFDKGLIIFLMYFIVILLGGITLSYISEHYEKRERIEKIKGHFNLNDDWKVGYNWGFKNEWDDFKYHYKFSNYKLRKNKTIDYIITREGKESFKEGQNV